MMIDKKALQTHLLVLLFISAIMTVLLLSVFAPFFKNDHPNCKNFKFELTKQCVDGRFVRVTVKNTGNTRINFRSDDAFSHEYEVAVGGQETMNFGSSGDEVDVIPFVKIQNEEFTCKGKTTAIKVERLMKCS